jgi:nifR3 family TIM-barrel protein
VKNFWAELPRPFFVLAPLANVTDAAFRRLIAAYSKVPGAVPHVTYTEFVSADGLVRANEEGRRKLMRDLVFSDAEHPIVAQFFTATPAHMEAAAALAQELGFDGVDINMGCPDRAVEKQGAGAKLMLNPTRAKELIAAAKRGAPRLPVSVKTRLGYNKDILDEWLPALLEAEPAVVTIHARTRKEMSKVPARWERVRCAVDIRNKMNSNTLIVGNGDAKDMADAKEKIAESGADGVMLGRAIFGRPWLFASPNGNLEIAVRLRILVEHTKLFEELLGDTPGRAGKSFVIMKKHFKAYVEGFPGAKELRVELMEAENAAGVERVVGEFLKSR